VLYVAELLHRVSNEYTNAISFASGLAATSFNDEAKAALRQVIDHLHALAGLHDVLRPPITGELVDLGESLTKLCRSMSLALFDQRGITLHLAVAEPVLLDARRCWLATLIVSELVTNAGRHAFLPDGGWVSVSLAIVPGCIVCKVSDDGSSAATFEPGFGTQLVDTLASEVNGCVKRRFSQSGTTVTLAFPKDPSSID
jgi:two-component sensor histidine kinase